MSSHFGIDTLIAVLHPHVVMSAFNHELFPPKSLQSSKDVNNFRDLSQAFATLFSFHPACDTAAVAACTPQAGNTSLSICLSPSTPREFETNVEKWLTSFTTLRRESDSTGDEQRDGAFSPLERRFIVETYKLCYPAMYQEIVAHGLGDWAVFENERNAGTHAARLKLTNEEEQLREGYAGELRVFSELVRTFANRVDRDSLGKDEEVLQFHELCMKIREKMSDEGFMAYLNGYICKSLALSPLDCRDSD